MINDYPLVLQNGGIHMDIQQERQQLIVRLRQEADPVRAANEKKYLKSPQQFHGVSVPTLRAIARTWTKANKEVDMRTVTELAARLWDSDWHEERTLAILLLQTRSKDLTQAQMPLIETMIHQSIGWAHLDTVATGVMSALIDRDPTMLGYLSTWIQSNNFWIRRAALLAQILQFRRGEGNLELFAQMAVSQLTESADWSKEERFFIRKAIGWALRELAPRQPAWVADFVQQHRSVMSSLTWREATRKLPPEYRRELG